MADDLRARLRIPPERLDEVNRVLLASDQQAINDFFEVVARYGPPEENNRKAAEASHLPNLLRRVAAGHPEFAKELDWLAQQRDHGAFISVADYRRQVLGDRAQSMEFLDEFAVTLEVSAAQYFSWVILTARRAIEERSLVPGRFIRVRKMKEQEADGDLPAFAAAMQILGASFVETLDTKGTDGSNVHLGGPETITGYFGGIGQPNAHALQWLAGVLVFYTPHGAPE